MALQEIKAIDIFSGAGLGSYGAKQAGVQTVCAIDMEPVAMATFADNFPNARTITSRLEDIDVVALASEIGDVDLMIASPECTNHTCARGARPQSEESRATALQAVRFARAFRPRWVVMENVVHMRPWSRYPDLKRQLTELGYTLEEQVLDASYFGVPQRRRRLFLVGDLRGRPGIVRTPRRRVFPNVESILDAPGTWKTTDLDSPRRAKATLERADRAFSEIGRQTPFLIVYYGTDGGGGWQTLDRPLRTVTTVDRFALVTPSEGGHQMRMLQVTELRKAMGLSSRFRLNHGTRREKVKLLGNGIAAPVMRAVVKALTESEQYLTGSGLEPADMRDKITEKVFA